MTIYQYQEPVFASRWFWAIMSPTVSQQTRDLDEAVNQFHQARLSGDYVYLFLDGVSLRVRRPGGR